MKKLLPYVMMLLPYFVFSQHKQDNFNVPIRAVQGDLNKDGLYDHVLVNMDTISETRPLRLQVFFAEANKKMRLVASSTQLIEAQYPIELEGQHNGNTIPNFYIEEGNLIMESYVNNQTRHTFRFKNGNFELIHFLKIDWDGKETTTQTKYNLLTGNYVEEYQLLGSEKVFERNKKNIPVKILPKLQNFIPFETEIY